MAKNYLNRKEFTTRIEMRELICEEFYFERVEIEPEGKGIIFQKQPLSVFYGKVA